MNINITEDLLKKCTEAGRAAAFVKQVEADATDFCYLAPDDEEDAPSREAFARAVIETWEASRTPGQLERTNHALALELAEAKSRLYEAMEAKEVAINREAEQMNRAENLKSETIQLKADVAELNDILHEHTQAFLTKWPRGVLPPWPVVKVEDPPFGNPPEGYTWHNPENLTPEQVETGDGWRLCLKEETTDIGDECIGRNGWSPGQVTSKYKYGELPTTYRTKAPLPR